jgi:integral membrane sensor domain MASE1
MKNVATQYRSSTFNTKLTIFILVAIAYFVTAWLGLMVPYKESVATLIWLPTGIAVGAIMRWGKVNILAVFIASFLVELTVLPLSTSRLLLQIRSAPFSQHTFYPNFILIITYINKKIFC